MTTRIPRAARRRRSVGVVIPCYNYGHYLPDAVRAATAQRDVDVKVVIVDDCSPDGSADVARRLAEADDRITVIAHQQNRGHIATYNDGLAAVDAEFVTLVSADDLIAPRALDRAVALMDRHPRVGLVHGKVVTFRDGRPTGPSRGRGLWHLTAGEDWIQEVLGRGFNPIISPEAVVRTEAMRSVGGYNAELPHSGDLEYWLRVAGHWDVGRIRGVVQAYYRVHGANMHLTEFDAGFDNIRQKAAAFDVVRSAGFTNRRAWADEMGRLGDRTLTEEALVLARRRIDEGAYADAGRLLAFARERAEGADQRRRAVALLTSVEERTR